MFIRLAAGHKGTGSGTALGLYTVSGLQHDITTMISNRTFLLYILLQAPIADY